MAITRRTKSVERLIEVFEKNKEAQSIVDLVERMRPYMNKTTVYRVLDRLEKEGIVHGLMDKHGSKWYAPCQDCDSGNHKDAHPHFQCNDCGKVECLPVEVSVPKVDNRRIDSTEILILGQCADCLA